MMRALRVIRPPVAARAALGLLALAVVVPVALAAPTRGARLGRPMASRGARVAQATAKEGARVAQAGPSQPGVGPAHGPPGPVVGPAHGPPGRYRIVGCRSRGAGAYRHGPPRREVAIGFDDGPAPDTAAFVSMLERSRAQATFFMIGEQLSGAYARTLMRELRDGDVLGDHSFTHPNLTLTGAVRTQLTRTIGAIRSLTGYRPCVFRPPYGAYNGSTVQIARSLGLATVLWNVDPSDYTQPGTRTIEQRVLSQVQPGSIIISHDGGGPRGETLAAYPSIIAALRARGYRVVTITRLLGFRPVYVPCIRLCGSIGVSRREVPRDAIIERAP
jgi:peptidoglycan/xylan/chitin deacetylase (PgdA/CDA1 family)